MGEPTHEVVRQSNGIRKNGTLKTLVTILVSIATVVASGWIGWVSHKTGDHESRICVVENSHAVIKEDVKVAKETIMKSALDLAEIQGLLQDIRDDQVRRQKKER
jgi:phospholipase C